MSKYEPLWQYIQKIDKEEFFVEFDEIKRVTGFEIDHSFLSYKKELLQYGYEVIKISRKEKKILIKRH